MTKRKVPKQCRKFITRQKGYTQVPNKIILSSELSTYARSTFNVILCYNPSYPSYNHLTKICRASRQTVAKGLRELLSRRMIRIAKVFKSGGYVYEVVDLKHWELGLSANERIKEVHQYVRENKCGLHGAQEWLLNNTEGSYFQELPPSEEEEQELIYESNSNGTQERDYVSTVKPITEIKTHSEKIRKIIEDFSLPLRHIIDNFSVESAERYLRLIVIYLVCYEKKYGELHEDDYIQFGDLESALEIVKAFDLVDKVKGTDFGWIQFELSRLSGNQSPKRSQPRFMANKASIATYQAHWDGYAANALYGTKIQKKQDKHEHELKMQEIFDPQFYEFEEDMENIDFEELETSLSLVSDSDNFEELVQ